MKAWISKYSSIGAPPPRFICCPFGRRFPAVGALAGSILPEYRFRLIGRCFTPSCSAAQVITHTGMRKQLGTASKPAPALALQPERTTKYSVTAHCVRAAGGDCFHLLRPYELRIRRSTVASFARQTLQDQPAVAVLFGSALRLVS